MAVVLQIDFSYPGPFGTRMAEGLRELALSIAEEPGLVWKIWTENETENRCGGIYLFEDGGYARDYLDRHLARLEAFGVTDVRAMIFDVNEALSKITRGPA